MRCGRTRPRTHTTAASIPTPGAASPTSSTPPGSAGAHPGRWRREARGQPCRQTHERSHPGHGGTNRAFPDTMTGRCWQDVSVSREARRRLPVGGGERSAVVWYCRAEARLAIATGWADCPRPSDALGGPTGPTSIGQPLPSFVLLAHRAARHSWAVRSNMTRLLPTAGSPLRRQIATGSTHTRE